MLALTGGISIKDNTATCRCCGAACEVERVAPGVTLADIHHKKSCSLLNMVKSFLESLRSAEDFIPKVENLIPAEYVSDFYADMTKAELQDIESLTNDIFAASSEKERMKLEPRLVAYDNHDVSTPILQRILKQGLNTPQDRANFKTFLVYLKSHQRAVEDFMLHAMSMEQERNEMSHLFSKVFDG